MADAHVVAPLRAALAFIVLMAMAAPAAAQDMHAAIQSTRGVQHKLPLISDDVVIGAIMIMFLMLFAFGMRSHRATHEPSHARARLTDRVTPNPIRVHPRRQAVTHTHTHTHTHRADPIRLCHTQHHWLEL